MASSNFLAQFFLGQTDRDDHLQLSYQKKKVPSHIISQNFQNLQKKHQQEMISNKNDYINGKKSAIKSKKNIETQIWPKLAKKSKLYTKKYNKQDFSSQKQKSSKKQEFHNKSLNKQHSEIQKIQLSCIGEGFSKHKPDIKNEIPLTTKPYHNYYKSDISQSVGHDSALAQNKINKEYQDQKRINKMSLTKHKKSKTSAALKNENRQPFFTLNQNQFLTQIPQAQGKFRAFSGQKDLFKSISSTRQASVKQSYLFQDYQIGYSGQSVFKKGSLFASYQSEAQNDQNSTTNAKEIDSKKGIYQEKVKSRINQKMAKYSKINSAKQQHQQLSRSQRKQNSYNDVLSYQRKQVSVAKSFVQDAEIGTNQDQIREIMEKCNKKGRRTFSALTRTGLQYDRRQLIKQKSWAKNCRLKGNVYKAGATAVVCAQSERIQKIDLFQDDQVKARQEKERMNFKNNILHSEESQFNDSLNKKMPLYISFRKKQSQTHSEQPNKSQNFYINFLEQTGQTSEKNIALTTNLFSPAFSVRTKNLVDRQRSAQQIRRNKESQKIQFKDKLLGLMNQCNKYSSGKNKANPKMKRFTKYCQNVDWNLKQSIKQIDLLIGGNCTAR